MSRASFQTGLQPGAYTDDVSLAVVANDPVKRHFPRW
jgi:hypothetical protein